MLPVKDIDIIPCINFYTSYILDNVGTTMSARVYHTWNIKQVKWRLQVVNGVYKDFYFNNIFVCFVISCIFTNFQHLKRNLKRPVCSVQKKALNFAQINSIPPNFGLFLELLTYNPVFNDALKQN